ncbi:MAG: YbaB/EbfC family nucleoid-associated protein [Bacteroidota bacterium]|nr:YbaB/EbfC family nucleoid-associated protein [Bacteroidota bacterium]MDP4231466.1 YbaB/EbfC family nucleoid-associated protein [Bacteroidota bacterium]MDP4234996.1 YbaB/EbfC family nucleoid-associated protein [Bacteroidota bacterium]
MNPELMKALEQVQKMQEEVSKVQESLGSVVATAEAGGGMVKITANGRQEIVSIKLEKEVIDPNEQEMLEDLIVAAANRALAKAKELAEDKMSLVANSFMPNIPGLR